MQESLGRIGNLVALLDQPGVSRDEAVGCFTEWGSQLMTALGNIQWAATATPPQHWDPSFGWVAMVGQI